MNGRTVYDKPLKVPEKINVIQEELKNIPLENIILPAPPKTQITNTIKKVEKYVPLWMPVLAFALILVAYVICVINNIHVNPYYEMGVLGISGLIAAICLYLKFK